jgi:RND family efflux transporter MFP subunit
MLTLVLCALTSLPCAVWAAPGIATVRAATEPVRLQAFARVEPRHIIRVRAPLDGTVQGLQAKRGDVLHRGEVIAVLSGPERRMELEQARAAAARAQAALHLAQQTLHRLRETYPGVSTRKELQRARADVAERRSVASATQARLQYQRATASVDAPVAARVLSVNVGDGQRVSTGDALLELAPLRALWLRAVFYGHDAESVHVGMNGKFRPVAGGSAVAVKVVSVLQALRADGGREALCAATQGSTTWRDGDAGTVDLQGAPRHGTVVPTSALVLDRGQWWVLLRTSGGDRPQAVVPGAAHGGETFIERGLQPGQRVRVSDVYLRFHRDFTQHYQPPD